ncbi:MAG: hypothetical protein Q8L90_16490 [Bacteroidota bacterium]|jgi:hypothetical protein|nr:hypothetical protein [Bacteroidia bacterium]MDP1747175.1 hypothetical protein [Bacteroidota bacterium]
MKTSTVILAFLILTVSSSCKKDYTCVCTNSTGTVEAFTVKTTKSKAEKQCNAHYQEHYGTVTFDQTTCELK